VIKNFNVRCERNEMKDTVLERLQTRINERKESKRQENKNVKSEIEL
jgi:hypothetical protein